MCTALKCTAFCLRSVSNANRRRLEDNLAVIFMAIVLFFLISHFPRIILGLQELLEPPHPIQCHNAGKRTWALWVLVFSHVSHLMLVLNWEVFLCQI